VIAQFFQHNNLAGFTFQTFSNDIDSRLAATSHLDARLPTFPQLFLSDLTSVSGTVPIPSNTIIITSPPYDRDGLFDILKNSFQLSQLVAMKLPLNFLDPGKPGNIDFLQIGSGLSRVIIMSRDVAGGEHGPRRERYTEAWLLWDRADISPAPPVVSFHHVDSVPAASLPATVSFACTPLLDSNRFMLPTNHAATATIFDFLQPLLSPASNLCTFSHESTIYETFQTLCNTSSLSFPLSSSDFARGKFDWLVCACSIWHVLDIVALAKQFCSVGFCVRVQLLFLEPVASRALSLCDDAFTDIIVMSGSVQRSSRMYADTWCIWRKAGSQRSRIGPQLYFIES